jgi:hypothetical protein
MTSITPKALSPNTLISSSSSQGASRCETLVKGLPQSQED